MFNSHFVTSDVYLIIALWALDTLCGDRNPFKCLTPLVTWPAPHVFSHACLVGSNEVCMYVHTQYILCMLEHPHSNCLFLAQVTVVYTVKIRLRESESWCMASQSVTSVCWRKVVRVFAATFVHKLSVYHLCLCFLVEDLCVWISHLTVHKLTITCVLNEGCVCIKWVLRHHVVVTCALKEGCVCKTKQLTCSMSHSKECVHVGD